MFDWGSFVTGLVGALIGGAASLLVQGISATRDRRARRREVVERVGLAFRDLVEPFVTHSKERPNSKEIFLGLQKVSAASTSLRLELTAKEVPVSKWVGAAVSRLGKVSQTYYTAKADERDMDAVLDVVAAVNRELAEWVTGQRKATWFADQKFEGPILLTQKAPSSNPEG